MGNANEESVEEYGRSNGWISYVEQVNFLHSQILLVEVVSVGLNIYFFEFGSLAPKDLQR